MKARKPELGVCFYSFLQGIFLTHRNSTKAHGDTPARLTFGESWILPAVVDFEIGQPMFFMTPVEKPAIPATYIVFKMSTYNLANVLPVFRAL